MQIVRNCSYTCRVPARNTHFALLTLARSHAHVVLHAFFLAFFSTNFDWTERETAHSLPFQWNDLHFGTGKHLQFIGYYENCPSI